jgi:hypothetical protein
MQIHWLRTSGTQEEKEDTEKKRYHRGAEETEVKKRIGFSVGTEESCISGTRCVLPCLRSASSNAGANSPDTI